MKKRVAVLLLVGAAVGFAALIAAQTSGQAAAQTETESDWVSPLNLSHSGAATDPVVVHAGRRFNILWRDTFDGFVYTSGDGRAWTNPTPVELPFGTRRYFPDLRDEEPTPRFTPRLAAGADGRIHAHWIDDWEGDESILYASSVAAHAFTDLDAWTERQELSRSALEIDVSIGPEGQLHLVYLQTLHMPLSPAGIHYRRLAEDGITWSEPVFLYETIYFRLQAPGDSHVMVTAGDYGRVFVAWEDSHLRKILCSRSADGGLTWMEPTELVTQVVEDLQPAETEEPTEPGRPVLVGLVSASAGGLHLLWQVRSGDVCTLYHQLSADGGRSWGIPRMLPGDPCAMVEQVLQTAEEPLLVHTRGDGGYAMLAWSGGIWSEPFLLPAEFEDAETQNVVQLGCAQVAFSDQGRLVVVGCDLTGGGDIWMLTQTLGASAKELFVTPTPTPTSVWGTPVQISLDHAETLVDARHPVMVGSMEGWFHLAWSQPAESDPDGPGRVIVYARWDAVEGAQLPRPVTLFTSPEEKAEQPALAADDLGRLHLVWSGGQMGEIMYSRAAADRAFNPTNWAEPQLLPMPQPAGSWPTIAIGRDGMIHVVYAVPLNERRGIYYTRSADGGQSWTEPATVADGAESGWAMVDHPALAVGGDGTLHVAWSALPLPGSLLPGAVTYARSSDGGELWSEPFTAAGGAVDWPELAAVGELEVHLVWGETAGRALRQHRLSADGGQNWSHANPVPGLEGLEGPVRLALDGAGRVHLAAAGDPVDRASSLESQGDVPSWLSIRHRMWDGEHWVEVEGGPLAIFETLTFHSSALSIAAGNRLGLVLAGAAQDETEADEDGVRSTAARVVVLLGRPLELPAVHPTPLPSLTPTPTPTPEPTPSATPRPAPTPDLSAGGTAARLQVGPLAIGSDWAGLVVGAVPAGLVVLLVFVIGAWVARRGRR